MCRCVDVPMCVFCVLIICIASLQFTNTNVTVVIVIVIIDIWRCCHCRNAKSWNFAKLRTYVCALCSCAPCTALFWLFFFLFSFWFDTTTTTTHAIDDEGLPIALRFTSNVYCIETNTKANHSYTLYVPFVYMVGYFQKCDICVSAMRTTLSWFRQHRRTSSNLTRAMTNNNSNNTNKFIYCTMYNCTYLWIFIYL